MLPARPRNRKRYELRKRVWRPAPRGKGRSRVDTEGKQERGTSSSFGFTGLSLAPTLHLFPSGPLASATLLKQASLPPADPVGGALRFLALP